MEQAEQALHIPLTVCSVDEVRWRFPVYCYEGDKYCAFHYITLHHWPKEYTNCDDTRYAIGFSFITNTAVDSNLLKKDIRYRQSQ